MNGHDGGRKKTADALRRFSVIRSSLSSTPVTPSKIGHDPHCLCRVRSLRAPGSPTFCAAIVTHMPLPSWAVSRPESTIISVADSCSPPMGPPRYRKSVPACKGTLQVSSRCTLDKLNRPTLHRAAPDNARNQNRRFLRRSPPWP